MIYLDNAATTFLKPKCVREAVVRAFNTMSSPGRGGYIFAKRASEQIYEAREVLSVLFNISSPERIVFTDNATTAINTALKGLIGRYDKLLISKMEHNAVARCSKTLENEGAYLRFIEADEDGYINVSEAKKALDEKVKVLCLIHASNVSGSLNDIESIGKEAHKNGALFMVDAAQSAGAVKIDVIKQEIDILAFPGHKGLFGPQGTGGLYIKEGINLKSLTEGGTGSMSEELFQPSVMPDRFESGTLNVPGIAGLCAGVRYILKRGVESIGEKERLDAKMLAEDLSVIKDVKVYGNPGSKESVGVVSISTPLDSMELAQKLSQHGICVRAGLHCSPLAHKSLGTFETGTVRFSPGIFTTKEQLKFTARIVENCLK